MYMHKRWIELDRSSTSRFIWYNIAGLLNVMFLQSFYCGYAKFCKDPNSLAAISLAKTNVETWFAVVGIMEEMELSLRVMEREVPEVFTGMLDTYKEDQEFRNGLPNGE